MSNVNYVFETEGSIIRYRYPTHINDLVIPRESSTCAEVFMVLLNKNEAPPLHKHDDTEQVFYMIHGEGLLEICPAKDVEGEKFQIHAGQVVRIPPKTWHRVTALSGDRVK